jgi:hypothetical protein
MKDFGNKSGEKEGIVHNCPLSGIGMFRIIQQRHEILFDLNFTGRGRDPTPTNKFSRAICIWAVRLIRDAPSTNLYLTVPGCRVPKVFSTYLGGIMHDDKDWRINRLLISVSE